MQDRISPLGLMNFAGILILSTALHEMAHAWTADRFGDDTPRRAGRLSFNPFVHLDPVMSILVPVALFYTTGWFMGWASTPVTPSLMRRPRLHGALCSLAGPLANLLLAGVTLGAAMGVMASLPGDGAAPSLRGEGLLEVLVLATVMNIYWAVFNLLPVPPLDGSHIVAALLPPRLAAAYESLHRYSLWIMAILFLTPAASSVLRPILEFAMDGVRAALHFARGFAGG